MTDCKRAAIIGFFSIFFSVAAMAQEICDNGIDDDGDGLIDCFDPDCSGSGSCSDFFFGNPILCENDPSVTNFDIALQWGSPNESSHNKSSVTVGDLNNDGIPEVIVTNHLENTINILNGQNGDWLYSLDPGFEPENIVAVGNINDDDCGEVFFTGRRGSNSIGNIVEAWNCDLTTRLWSTRSNLDRAGNPALADFNQDGVVEFYHANEIINAETGAIIVPGTGQWDTETMYGSVAVDIFPDSFCADCSGLELVDGPWIYAVNIAAGTKTLIKQLDDILPSGQRFLPKRWSWGDGTSFAFTSVADFDTDGDMDVFFSGALGTSTNDQTTIFFWDPVEDQFQTYADVSNNFERGTGRINIADMDNDGNLNISYVSNQKLYCLDENMDPLWIKGIVEGSSGFTGCSLFDFDGDGSGEVIYRSEGTLHIIDGTDGSTRNSIYCQSRTWFEYPIVADVDGDGASELIVTCSTSDALAFDPYSGSRNSHVRVYEAANGERWQPSRSVWNQHGYFAVNVNDDLTIPIQQQDHTIAFSDGGCPEAGIVGEVRSLNSFLNQAPFLNQDGCAEYSQPDFSIGDNITFSAPTCPDTEFSVSFLLSNVGDLDLSGNLPITFYSGDPTVAGSVKLNTIVQPLVDFNPGDQLVVTGTVQGPGGDFELFISINDVGTQNPPIDPDAQVAITECETVNNLASVSIVSEPFNLSVSKISDNNKCDDALPDNGSARAFYLGDIPSMVEVAWLEDFEDLTVGDESDNGATAWSKTHSLANDSRISEVSDFFSGNSFFVNNSDEEVVWTSQSIDISSYVSVDITMDLLSDGGLETSEDYVQVFYILDGGTAVQMNNGSQVGDFSYAQATASGLTGSTLTIRARIFNTGGSERYAIDNIRVVGMTPPETGEFTDDFTFRWYNQNDFSTVLFTGSEFPTMAEGTYSVIGFSNLGNCFSDTASIQIDRIRIDPIGIAFESNEPINCLMPNGEITAGAIDVNDYDNDGLTTDTVTIGYSFVLFNGSFRTDDDIVGTGSIIGNLEAGDYEYVITDLQSGCDVTQQVSLRSPNILPTIVFDSKVDVTSCADLNTGSATVSSPDDVTFLWYDGGTVRATEDFTGPTYSGIPPGEYTVVAQDNNTGCKSLPLVIEIEDLTGTPEAVATAVSPNTSCEAGTGSATATGDTGSGPSVAGFDFEWYAGLFTSEVANNRLPGALAGVNISADGATASNLPDGFYTVVVTETATGCFDIDTVEVRANFEIPEFTFRTPVDTEDAVVIGGNGYVEIPQTLAGLTSFTISYWADFTPDNYSADERTFSSGATGENQVLLWSDNHDGLAFVVDGVAGSRGRINSAYSATGWTQVVGTYDASTGDMFMYANGVQIGSTTYNGGAVRDTGNPMFIGRDNNPNYGKFEGTLDEVRIYNIALSPEDIVEQMCRELTGSEAGLIAYYDFNNVTGDTDGTIIPDVSGNGNDGTLREPDASSSISTVTADIECPITTIDANTSCDASNPNGIIDVSNDITPAGGDYTFSLYEGFSTATLLESNSTGIFTGYAGGFYTLSAEDNTTGCITSPSVVSLPDIPDNPNIATVVVDDQGCNSAGLGEILVTASSNTTRNGSIVEPASYTFEIFNGANTTDLRQTESITDGATGFNFTGLADGVYRIRVTNDDLTCFSVLDVNVGSNEILPVIDASFTNVNASCDPANPSGQMIVQFTGDPADFTFRWYTGDVVDENQRIAGESGSTLSGLAAGNYTVVMVSNLTECVSLPATETISDQPLFPDITIETVNDLTNCDGSNGSLRAYVIDPDNPSVELDEDDGYTFQWYTGNTVTAGNEVSNADGGNTSTIINQGAGEYIVEVTFTSFSCSNTEVSTINDATVLPVLTLANTASTENTICDPGSSGSYDGTATVNALTIDGTTVNLPNADYTFRWYQGTDVTGTLLGETSNILSQRQDGSYTVVARNTVTGCESSPITITIDPLFVFPDVTLIDTDDNIICDPTLTPTGEITIRPTVGNITDYNFTWFSGQTTDPTENVLDDGASVTVTSTDNIVSNIAGGTYRVLVENIATGCSETFDFTINDTPTTPEIDGPNSEVNDNTLCSLPGDGSIIAALNLAGIEINGVDNDQIWQNISSCNTVVLDDATTIGTNGFQLTTATNNQFGRIWLGDTVDLSQPLRLDFRLYLGDKDANGADGIALTFHRDPRGYDARGGVGQDLGVGDTRGANTIPQVTPSFSVEFDDFQNGDIDDPAFDHTNLFFNGDIDVQITPPVQIADGLDNVENGDTLDVTFVIRQIGGEQNLRLFVNESMRFEYTGDIVNDIFGGATDVIAGFTSSTGGSNNDQAVFIEPFLDRFEFDWYDGSSVDAANIRSEKDPFLCGLSGGQYTLVVTDNTTGCVSAPFTYQVEDTGAVPNFTLDATNSINNGVCDPALATTDNNGRITITPEDGSDPSDYTYEWFDGDNTSAPGITGAITNVLDEIDGGTYTVRITQTSNSCDEIFQFSIIDETTDPVLPVAAANTTDLTVCLGGTGYPNGTISVTDASIVGSGPYTYRYYIGTSVDPDSLIDDDDNIFLQIDPLSSTVGVTVSGSSTDNISGLTSGQYTVVAISTVSGCISNPVTVTVDEVQSAPVFDVDAIGAGSENNAVCDITLAGGPTEYSGQISITQGTGSSPGPFSFQWYTGSGTSSPITGETGQVLANIQGGTYTVMITDDITNCTTLVEATIIDDTNDPEIPDVTADVDIQDVSLCNGADGFPNGEIDVIEANITSGGPFGSGTYVFRYYFGSSVDPDSLITDGTSVFAQQGTTPPATGTVSTVNGANTDNITGLGVGTYTIVAIEDNTGCASDPVTVNIGESQSAPVFTVASIGAGSENNAVCDITLADGPTEYSGQISITQGTGSSPGPFSFQWYTGSGTSSPIGGETGQVLANIEGGTYTVMITDDITNCTALVEATIINETNDPAIPNVTTDVDIEDVSLCSGANGFPNGEIDVVEANITSGGAFGSGTYVFRYYFGSTVDPDSLITDGTSVFAQQGTTPPATGTVSTVMGASTDNITGLGTGVYTVVAIEDNTGCSSDPVTVTIGESQNAPVFTVDAIGAGSENNAVCDITIAGGPTEYSGQISVTQGVGSSAGPFSFQWYTGSGTSAPISGETGQVLANIQGGTYTVMITDDVTNCTTLIEATIVDDTNDPIIPDVTTDVDVQDVSLCSGANGFPDGGIEVVEANLTSGGAFGSGSYIYRYYFGSSVDADSLITNGTSVFAQKGTNAPSTGTVSVVQGAGTENITGLGTGTYTVVAIEDNTGCISNPVTVVVGEDQSAPVFTIDAIGSGSENNSVCDISITGGPTEYDGQISISQATGSSPGPFSFQWYTGSGTSASIAGETSQILDNIQGGTYTVMITDNTTNCTALLEATITDDTNDPSIGDLTAGVLETNVSNCTGLANLYPDGAITIVETEITGTGPYSYEYYFGLSAVPADRITDGTSIFDQNPDITGPADARVISGSATSTILGLNGGEYLVVIVDRGTGCKSDPIPVTIEEDVAPLELEISGDNALTFNNPVCDDGLAGGPTTFGGQITVVRTDGDPDLSDFTFEWYTGTNLISANELSNTDNVLEGIEGGTYTVVITSISTNCTLELEHTIINETTVPEITDPTISVSPVDVTVCEGGTGYPNGGLIVDLAGISGFTDAGDYLVNYYFGTSAVASTTAAKNPLDTTNTFDIFNQKLSGGTSNASNVRFLTGLQPDSVGITGLDAGSYTITVMDIRTGCISLPVTVEVIDNPVIPTFTQAPIDNTVCDITRVSDFNGSITLSNPSVGSLTDYTYKWFLGQSTDVNDEIPTNKVTTASINATGNAISELPGGTYTVEITNSSTNCVSTLEFTLDDDFSDIPVVVTDATTDVTVCEGNDDFPNGGVNVTSVTGGSNDYSFEWYFGTTVDAANIISDGDDIFAVKGTTGTIGANGNVSITNNGATITGLDGGTTLIPATYTLRVIDNITGCTSAIENYTINNAQTPVTGTITVTADDFSCDSSNPTGRLVAAETSGGATYSYEWYSGSSAAGVVIETSDVLDNRSAGNYTVKIINNSTSCFITLTETIERIPPDVVLSLDGAVTPQTFCDPANGSITVQVNTPIFTGSTPTGFTANFEYQWYTGQTVDAANIIGGATTETLSGLVAGFYTVVATETSSGCVSTALTAEVPDGVSADAPTIETAFNTIPSSCAATDGEIVGTINLVGNPSGRDFSFEWYEGSADFAGDPTLGTPLVDGATVGTTPNFSTVTVTTPNTVGGTGSATLSGLVSGLYTLVAEDLTTGCRFQQVFDLPFNGIQATATITIDHVTECPDNGTATVSLADEVTFDYNTLVGDFELGDILTGGTSNATIVVNNDNDTDELSGSVTSGTFLVGETISNGSGSSAVITAISNVGFTDGLVDDISEYDIYLYAGSGVPADRETVVMVDGFPSPTIINTPGTIAPGGSVTFSGLPAGVYTAVAREKAGTRCFSLAATDEIDQRAYEPIIDDFTIVDNTICDEATFNGNGSITVSTRLDVEDVFNGGQARFRWFAGADTTTNPVAIQVDNNTNTSTLSNLDPGQYTVSIERISSPEDALAITNIVGDFENGETITGNTSGATASFDRLILDTQDTLYIYSVTGTFTAGEEVEGGTSGATADIIAGGVQESGISPNGCIILSSYNVQDIPDIHEIFSANIVNQTDCNPNNASITIENDDISINGDASLGNFSDYDFTWYQGSIDVANVVGGSTNTLLLTTLGVGTYFVVAENTATGCITAPFRIDVTDNTVDPEVTVMVASIDSSCDPDVNEGNGSITFTIDNPQLGSDYDFQWHVGTTTGVTLTDNGVISGASGTLNGAGAGDYTATLSGVNGNTNYTLEIIDRDNPNDACDVLSTIFLNETISPKTLRPSIDYTVVNNTNCNPPAANNGDILISSVFEDGIAQPVGNYTFTWFNSSGSDITVSAIDNGGTDNQLSGLAAGTYQVLITNNITFCESDNRIDIVVEDDSESPVIELDSKVDDTFCDGTEGSGSLNITVTDGGTEITAGTVGNYSISWFRGATTSSPALAAPAVIGGIYSNELSGLSAGQYTVEIIKTGGTGNIGCSVTNTFTIGSNQPVLSISDIDYTLQNNLNCTPDNGFIEIDSVRENGVATLVDATNYDFQWFNTAGVDITSDPTFTVNGITTVGDLNRIENLAAGTYSVIATNTATDCTTDRIFITIEDEEVLPVINATLIDDDTFCDNTGNQGNGRIDISITEDGAPAVTGNYTITWYRGSSAVAADEIFPNDPSTVRGSAATVDNLSLTDLSAGQYTVTILKNGTSPNAGCEAEATFTVGSDQAILSLTALDYSIQNNQNCSPNENGFIEIDSVRENGIAALVTAGNYTFQWFEEGVAIPGADTRITDGLSTLGTDNRLEQLTAGTYSVIATNAVTGCNTGAFEILIGNEQIDPSIVINSIGDDAFCDNGTNGDQGNGAIDLTVFEGTSNANLGNYTVTWFRGDDETIADNEIFPTDVAGGLDRGSALQASLTNLTDLSAGDYTVVITKNDANSPNAGCSVTSTITVGRDQAIVSIDVDADIDKSDNLNCVNPNGFIEVTQIMEDGLPVAITTTNYSFQWFDNAGAAILATDTRVVDGADGTDNRLEGLEAGNYSVVATNTETGCATGMVVTILDDTAINPTVQLVGSTADMICTTAGNVGNGELTISITDNSPVFNIAEFDITWFRGDDETIATNEIFPTDAGGLRGSAQTADNLTLTDLQEGQYTVVVTKSAAASINAGCSTVSTFTIDSNEPTLSISDLDYSFQNNQNCSPNENGFIEIDSIRVNGVAEVVTALNYTFEWFEEGVAILAADSRIVNGLSTAGNRNRLQSLESGTYSVIATNVASGCTTGAFQIIIDDEQVNPNIVINSIGADTFCDNGADGDQGNGSIEISVEEDGNPAVLGNYTITWFRGDDETIAANEIFPTDVAGGLDRGSALQASLTNLTDLSAGDYTVVITKNDANSPNAGCSVTSTITVGRDQAIVSIDVDADIDKSDNLNCVNPNGFIEVTQIMEDGLPVAITTTNYSFQWFDNAGAAILATDTRVVDGADGTDNRLEGLEAGNYSVIATNTETGCATGMVVTILDDTAINPTIQLVSSIDDEICETAGNVGSGELTISITDNSPVFNIAEFDITWFRGDDETIATNEIFPTDVGGLRGSAVTADNLTLTDLQEGQYTVVVTKSAASSINAGCSTVSTFTIDSNEPTLSISDLDYTFQDNQNCSPNENGFIEIDSIRVNGVAEVVTASNYTFEWFEEGVAILAADSRIVNGTGTIGNGNRLENLDAGTYSVVATNTATACETGSTIIIIEDTQVLPVIQIAAITDDTFCDNGVDGNQGDGTLSINIVEDGSAADATQYSITWFRGSDTTPANQIFPTETTPGTVGSAMQVSDTDLTGLSEGTYTVMVEKDAAISPNAGCASVATFQIEKSEVEINIGEVTAIAGNENCVSPNGFIEITEILENGNPVAVTPANYSFQWFNGATDLTGDAIDGIGTGNRLENLTGGTYTVIATSNITGCISGQFEIEVEDLRIDPSIVDINLVDNTNCSPGKNGSITVTAQTGTATSTYTFAWFDGQGTGTAGTGTVVASGTAGLAANESRYEDLGAGDYTVEVTDTNTGCTVTGTFTIGDDLVIPTLTIQDANIVPDTLCFPATFSGAITITDSDVSTGNLEDFNITIEKDAIGSGDVRGTFNASTNDEESVTGLEPGEYWITAELITTGCSVAPFRVNIEDISRNPEIELISITNNFDCGGGLALGGISILADGQSSANPDYTFQWYVGNTATVGQEVPDANGGNTETIASVTDTVYTVTVARTSTGCTTEQTFIVPNEEILPVVTNVEVNNQTTCFENGSIVILEVMYNGSVVDESVLASQYTIEWFDNPNLNLPAINDPVPATPLELDSLGAGTYYLTVRKNDDQCRSAVSEFVIEDNSFLPEIFITQIAADSTCTPAGTPSGILVATADGRDSSNPDYTFTWYLESDYPANPIVSSDSLIGFSAGDYLVEVMNTATGCSATAVSRIENVTVIPDILDAVATNPNSCAPINGSIQVTQVSSGDIADYTFAFYDTDPSVTPTPTPIQDSASDSLGGVDVGTYFIIGTNTVTGCESTIYQISIENSDVAFPEIILESFEQQRNCDPSNPNGSLTVSAGGSQDLNLFQFDWFDADGNQIESNSVTADSLRAFVDYRVVVTELATGCSSEETFEVGEDIPVPLAVNVTSSPNFNCTNPNGSIGVSIIQARRSVTDYSYFWYIGRQENPDPTSPDFEGRFVENLVGGVYTVLVIDNVDNFCTSAPSFIEVEDLINLPEVELTIEQALTNCDPTIPNGRISASSPSGDISTFTFEWYVGTDTLDQTPFFVGITADSLEAITYTVVITDLITGCKNQRSIQMPNEQAPVPTPGIAVIGQNTSCVSPNGSATASVSGNTEDFFFEWFSQDDPNTVIATGPVISGLAEGFYEVRATEIATGCVSERDSVQIELDFVVPVFDVETISNNCIRTEDGGANQFSGRASLRFSVNATIDSIAWLVNGDESTPDLNASNNFAWIDAPPGDHIVRVFTVDRCDFYDQSFTIDTDIVVYNGVSDNTDNKNDFFLIDCIEFFPNNRVEIFDRVGQKIYEIDGYDNIDRRFEGVANTGGTLGSARLPEGTYYYIIDKGDGTRPVQGYLELVR